MTKEKSMSSKKRWRPVTEEEIIDFIDTLFLSQESKDRLIHGVKTVAEQKNEYLLWRVFSTIQEENEKYMKLHLN